MTAPTDRVLIVVPILAQSRARTLARVLDPDGGDGAFGALLSPLGTQPATHCWTSWAVSAADRDWLLDPPAVLLAGVTWRAYDARASTPETVLAANGLRPVSTVID